jgi:cold-inducible RNA-binding protein
MTNIYVGNLDFATSEDQLRTLFEAYGAVKTVTIVPDRDTGQARGFAFVDMTSAGEARDAIRALDGSVHGGRIMLVNEARPKLYPVVNTSHLPVGITRDHRHHRIE